MRKIDEEKRRVSREILFAGVVLLGLWAVFAVVTLVHFFPGVLR